MPCCPQRAQDQGRPDEDKGVVVAHGQPTDPKQDKHIEAGERAFDPRPKMEFQRHEHGVESEYLRARRIRPDDRARAKERGGHEPGRGVARPRLNHGARQSSGRCHRHGREQIHSPNGRMPKRKHGEQSCQECEQGIARRMGDPTGERSRCEFTTITAGHRGSQSRNVERHQDQKGHERSEASPHSRLVQGSRSDKVALRAFGNDALALSRCRPAFSHGLVR